MTDTFQPYDIEIEQALIGAMLLDQSLISVAAEHITVDEFFDQNIHGALFTVMQEMSEEEGAVISPLTLWAHLKAIPEWTAEDFNGRNYIAGLAKSVPAFANADAARAMMKRWCKIVREFSLKREALQSMDDARAAITRTALPLSTIMRGVASVSERAAVYSAKKRALTADEIGERIMATVQSAEKGEMPPSITTGLARVDDKIGGLRASDFSLWAGMSGMGKSALLAGVSMRAAIAGHPTLIFSFDMTADQWMERNFCDRDFDLKETGDQSLWYSRLRNGKLLGGELGRIELARQSLRGIPLEICDERNLSILDVSARAKNFAARYPGKLGMIVVDYAQKVRGITTKGSTREREVASIAEGLKNLAGLLDWHVAAGSQVNKGDTSKRDDVRKPKLDDLRESAVLGNEADAVFSPWRMAYFIRNQKPGPEAGPNEMEQWKGRMAQFRYRLELLCLKYRHGEPFDDMDLYCDIGANAIRDHAPSSGGLPGMTEADLLSLADNAR